jgi:hypothetical protein
VADVLELAPLDLARGERQARMLTFERLDAGQFVGTDKPLASLCPRRGLPVERADLGDLGAELLVGGRRS